MKKETIFFVLLLFALSILLTAGDLKKISFEQAYLGKGEKLFSPLPRIISWVDDEHYYEIKDKKLYAVEVKTCKSKLVLDPTEHPQLEKLHLNPLYPQNRTNGFEKLLFLRKDGIYLYILKTKALKKIASTNGKEQNPSFSPDGEKIAYTLEGNLYVHHIGQNRSVQVTSDGSETILNGYASWVYYEEILGRRGRYRAFWWSPDSKKIAFMKFDQSKVPIFNIVRFNGDYANLERQYYPKSGYPNPTVKIAVAILDENEVKWIDHPEKGDQYLAFPRWNKDGTRIYYQWMNRGQDHLKIMQSDLSGKNIKTVYEERQKHWVEFFEGQDLFILKNNDLILRSSKDGWYHLYHVGKGKAEKKITSGDWSVRSVEYVDEPRNRVYFTARKEDSTETDLYRTDVSNGKTERLTNFKGTHQIAFSKRGSYFTDTYSNINTPTKMDMKDKDGNLIRLLGDRKTKAVSKYVLPQQKLIRIETSDGYRLPALITYPADFDEDKKYPVILSIYGGPGAAMVSNRFSTRLGNKFLAQEGIIVVSVDHRGSGHFGKKGIDLMHRNLGKWEMHDFIESVKYLKTLPFVDEKKIGITGGSYGGYVTALALTRASDHFNYGIAKASVIDWKFYDSVYTERYMDTPKENPEGYKNGSVLSYVAKYRGGLRIEHGIIDDNVHMQNTMHFVDKMIDEGKDFELMLYPGNRHGNRGKKREYENRASVNFWLRNFFGRQLQK